MTYLQNEIAIIQAEADTADRAIANLTTQISDVSQGQDAIRTRLEPIHQRLAELTARIGQMSQVQSELNAIQTELANLAAQIDNTIRSRDAAAGRAATNRQRLSELINARNQIPNVRSQLEACDRRVAELTQRLTALQRNRPRRRPNKPWEDVEDTAHEEWLAQIEQVNSELSDAQSQANSTRQRLADLTTAANQIPQAEAEIAAGDRDAANYSAQLDALNRSQAEVRNRLNAKQQQLSDLRAIGAQITQVQAELAAGEREIAIANTRIEQLRRDRDAAQGRANTIYERLSHLIQVRSVLTQEPTASFDVLEPIAAELTARALDVKRTLAAARERRRQTQAFLALATQATASLPGARTNITAAEQQVNDLNRQIDQRTSDRNAARDRAQTLRQQLSSLDAQINQVNVLQAQANEANQQVRHWDQEINSLAQQIAALQAELSGRDDPDMPRGPRSGKAELVAQIRQCQRDQAAARQSRSRAAEQVQSLNAQIAQQTSQLPGLRAERDRVQQTVNQADQETAACEQQLTNTIAQREAARHQLTQLRAELDRLTTLSTQTPQAQADAAAAAQQVSTLEAKLTEWSTARDAATSQLMGFTGANKAAQPLALLPVRLETRFRMGDRPQLLIRIYPDDIHVDTHEPELTDDEVIWGQHYWEQIWQSGDDKAIEQRAWNQLAERFGAERAEWIVQALEPLNLADATVPAGALPQFPEVARRPASWTRAPQTCVLPDRWVAIGYLGGNRLFTVWSQPLPDRLATGPSPQADLPDTDDGLPGVNAGMQWMLDFDTAIEAGMGIRVALTPAQLQAIVQNPAGLERLVVLGVKTSLDGATGSGYLENLIAAHQYTSGMAFVPQGTPTNNTPNATSGYRSRSNVELERQPSHLPVDSDGALTAIALGLRSDLFAHIPQANNCEQQDAQHLNTALWSATWGYFFEHMWVNTAGERLTPLLSNDTIEATRQHFIRYVRSRGPLPAVRIGDQPYGLLPVTALDWWQPAADGNSTDGLNVLRSLRHIWQQGVSNPKAKDLLDLLQHQATSSRYSAIELLGGDYAWNLATYWQQSGALTQLRQNEQDAIAKLQALGLPGNVRLARNSYLSNTASLTQPLVQPGSLDSASLDPNYLEWLAAADDRALRQGLEFSSPKPLLYQLLRHAALLEYSGAAFQLLQQQGIVNWSDRPEPELIDITGETGSTPTPSRWLERAIDNQPLGAYLSQLQDFSNPAVQALGEFRQSLRQLATRSAAALDRLLPETLDLCSHRLDAWITSLATRRLTELRQHNPKGTILGGYGWVENLRPALTDRRSEGYIHAPSLTHAATAAVLRNGYLSHQDDDRGSVLAIDLSSERVRLGNWLLDGVRQGQPLAALLGYRFERSLHETHRELTLQRYILPFRKLAPIAVKTDDPELDKAIAQAQAAITQAEDKTNALTGQVTQQEATLAAAKNRATPLQARLNDLETTRDRKDRERNRLDAETLAQVTNLNIQKQQVPAQIQQFWQRWYNALPSHVKPFITVMPPNPGTLAYLPLRGINIPSPFQNPELLALQAKPQQLDAQIRQIQDNARTTRQRLNDEIASLDQQIPPVRNELGAAKDAIEQQARSLETLRRQLDQAKGEASQARNRLNTLIHQERPMEAIAATNVVDGLELLRRWRAGSQLSTTLSEKDLEQSRWNADTIPFGKRNLPALNTPEANALLEQLEALADAVDAVSDLVTAESVYHLVRGNPLRAGATLDAVARGETPPPEMEVTRTPRSGIGLTHRICVLFSKDTQAIAPWETTHRAQAEPRLNAWIAQLLGDPARAICQVTYHHPETGDRLGSEQISLADLHLSPLDIICMTDGGQHAQQSELEQRLIYTLQRRPNSPSNAAIQLNFSRHPDWSEEIVSVAEFLEMARATRKLVMSARAIDARDLSLPEVATDENVDLDDLRNRATGAIDSFREAAATLPKLDTTVETINTEALRTALLHLANFGVMGAIPLSAIGDTPNDQTLLLNQAQAIRKEVEQRLTHLSTTEAAFNVNAAPAVQLDHYLSLIKHTLGSDFPILPRCRPTQPAELALAFANSTAIQGNDPIAAVTWFQQMTHVRDGAARLNAALTYAEALDTGAQLTLEVGQLPYQTSDRWVALPTTPEQPIAGGRLSLVAHLPNGFDAEQPISGLLIDEWVEVVPNASETTGVTFHFDQPGARAPQAVLLAVPPNLQTPWNLDSLETTLLETLELAKLRTADPTLLTQINHFLPALYFANNPTEDTLTPHLTTP